MKTSLVTYKTLYNMKYLVNDITYDTDGEQIDLPTELIIEVPESITEDQEIEEFLSDAISNETGFCHKGFSVGPTKEEILEEMEAHNNDEVGINNQWTYEDAEFYLLNSDKYHYLN